MESEQLSANITKPIKDNATECIKLIQHTKNLKTNFLNQLHQLIRLDIFAPLNCFEESLKSIEDLYNVCIEVTTSIEKNAKADPESMQMHSDNINFVNETFKNCRSQLEEAIAVLKEKLSSAEINKLINEIKSEICKALAPISNKESLDKSIISQPESKIKFITSKPAKSASHKEETKGNPATKETTEPVLKKNAIPKHSTTPKRSKSELNSIIMESANSEVAIANVNALLDSNGKMKLVNFNFMNFVKGCKEFSIFLDVIERCKYTKLYLSNIKCQEFQWKKIAEAIKTNSEIEAILLHDIQIESMNLWEEVLKCSILQKFIVRSCIIKAVKSLRWGEVFKFITANQSTLKVVGYINCGLDDMCAEDLKDALFKNNFIVSLDISKNNFTQKGLKEIKRYKEKNSTLKELIISPEQKSE